MRAYAGRLAAAGPGAIGFLYYSGHGAAEQGSNVNYVIPVDATDPADAGFWDASVRLDDILKILQERAPRAVHFVVFDACRNELLLPEKAATKGLAPIPTPDGMVVGFATQFGRTASDVGQGGGPYAKALAAELVKPGFSNLDLFQNVREAVATATDNKQQPWALHGLSRRVFLAWVAAVSPPVVVAPPVAAPLPAPAPVVTTLFAEAQAAWPDVRDSKNEATLENFIRRYGDTFFGDEARRLLAEIRQGNADAERTRIAPAAVSPSTSPGTNTPTTGWQVRAL